MLLVVNGCALFDTRQERMYAEVVFRQQNKLTDRIMEATETLSQAQYYTLMQAELKMHDDCRLLNEYATRERDGLPVGLLFSQQVHGSIDSCSQAVDRVEKLLHAMQIAK